MKNKLLIQKALLPALAICGLLFSSCYKEFDPKSYQPVFSINGYASSSEIGAGHLVGYWAFEGHYKDSVSGAEATGVNTSFSSGFVGKAMQGGANAYAICDLPAGIKNVKSFTIDFWINTPQNTSGIITPITISKDDDFWGSLDMFYENGSTANSATFKVHIKAQSEVWFTNPVLANPWNAWQNIALSYDAATSTFSVYQGGGLVASTTSAGLGDLVFQNTASKLIFGTEQFNCTPSLGTAGGSQGWADYLRGKIDEVRIYDKALSTTELQSLIVLQGKGK